MKLLTAPLLAVFSMAALAACGSDPDPAGASGDDVGTAQSGKLVVCSALAQGSPPSFYFDESHEPIGAEVDLAKAVGEELGLQVSFRDTEFAAIVPTLQAGQCDVIMSSLYIKPERTEVVDMVPYIMSGTSVVVATGSDAGITGMDDSLCGHTVAAVTGTTATALAEEQAAACETEGLGELKLQQNTNATAGLQQLDNGQIDAYADGTPLLLYYMKQREGSFELAGEPFGAIEVGAAVDKGNTALETAIAGAVDELVASGRYDEILGEWGLEDLSIARS